MEGLVAGVFHPSLRVKGYQSKPGWYGMTWAPDGRALWRYGDLIPGQPGPHSEWLQIGTHKIFRWTTSAKIQHVFALSSVRSSGRASGRR
ncbi:hypothetical protein [Frankia sp. AvcI1]|uniref:hypothetical protein n=1 Tax=Frankia sp. AvcI1 TaxID=573496 RepID=UPI002118796D|nr:hypothetical protein [Frankia sp. AvcI1]